MHQCAYLQECVMNALLRAKNAHIRLEFKINDAILFIHAHLSPSSILNSNFLTVFSVRSSWNLRRTLGAPFTDLTPTSGKRCRFYILTPNFAVTLRRARYFHQNKLAFRAFKTYWLCHWWECNFAWKVRQCSVTYACGYQNFQHFSYFTLPSQSLAEKSWWAIFIRLLFQKIFESPAFQVEVCGHKLKNSAALKR